MQNITPSSSITLAASTELVPGYIISENVESIEGVVIRVIEAQRGISSQNNSQLVRITYKINTKRTFFSGFNFEAEELILDIPTNMRVQAIVTTDDCAVHSNETCSATAFFELPLDVNQVSFYYVSNNRKDGLEPVQVFKPDERRLIASINLSKLAFSPLSAEALSLVSATETPITSAGQPSFFMGLDSIDSDPYGIEIYTTSDDLLNIRGNPERNEMVGQDMNGFVVKYYYWDIIYTLKYREENGISAYRVVEVQGR